MANVQLTKLGYQINDLLLSP